MAEKEKVRSFAEHVGAGSRCGLELVIFGTKPRRISLPAYPFAKVRCWIQDEAEAVSKRDDGKTVIHSLLHENTSDLWELKFTSVLPDGNSFH